MESNADDTAVLIPRNIEGIDRLNQMQRAQMVATLDRTDALVSEASPPVSI